MRRPGGTHPDSPLVLAMLVFSSVSLLGYGIGVLYSLVDFSSEGLWRIKSQIDMKYK